MTRLAPLSHEVPFRLGTTSYIIPDETIPNAEFLGPLVDDVELILFESHEISNVPDAATVTRLCDLAREHGLTYTVHLPLDAGLGLVNEDERRRSVGKCERIIRTLAPVTPFAYIVHFHENEGLAQAPKPSPHWLDALRRSADELLGFVPAAELLAVETLSYPFEWVAPIVEEFDLSICLDVGHVLLGGEDLAGYVGRYGDRTRVVHLHGIRDGHDHRDIGGLADATLSMLLSWLARDAGRERVVTLEVFDRADFEASMTVLGSRL